MGSLLDPLWVVLGQNLGPAVHQTPLYAVVLKEGNFRGDRIPSSFIRKKSFSLRSGGPGGAALQKSSKSSFKKLFLQRLLGPRVGRKRKQEEKAKPKRASEAEARVHRHGLSAFFPNLALGFFPSAWASGSHRAQSKRARNTLLSKETRVWEHQLALGVRLASEFPNQVDV